MCFWVIVNISTCSKQIHTQKTTPFSLDKNSKCIKKAYNTNKIVCITYICQHKISLAAQNQLYNMKMQKLVQLFNSVATTEGKKTQHPGQNKSISFYFFFPVCRRYMLINTRYIIVDKAISWFLDSPWSRLEMELANWNWKNKNLTVFLV